MKTTRAAVVGFVFILCLAAQSLSAQKPAVQPVAAAAPVPSLSASLTDLGRVSEATESDLADLQTEKSHSGWKTGWMFWHKKHPHSQEAEQMAASLQKNLHEAMPGLIQDAQNLKNFSATFKVYHNLSVVCGLLDSLVEATKSGGKGGGPLALDAVAMGHIRQDLAAYLERSAAALDSRSNADTVASSASSTAAPAKPNAAPQKKPAKKRVIVN